MASWAAYLLSRKAATAPAPDTTQPGNLSSKKFVIKPFDPSSRYGGKAAEDALVESISKPSDSTQSIFVKGSRSTQSDANPKQQSPQIMVPERAQSNASRVARLFGYGAPAQDEPPPEEQAPVKPSILGNVDVGIQPIASVQSIAKQDKAPIRPVMGLRDVVRVVIQPKMLKIVNEAVEQEEERLFLEYEKKSEQIRIERDTMEAERQKMFQAQEKMRLELERMAQEEEEMLEFCKIMGIEGSRPRCTAVDDQLVPSIGQPPPKIQEERERTIETRRERQLALDQEIALQEAKKLEDERLEQMSSEAVDKEDSSSEYEDELGGVNDDYDAHDNDNDMDLVARLRKDEEAQRIRAKKECEAALRRHEDEVMAERLRLEEEEFNREAEQMEVDRIARARKRVYEGEKRRHEQELEARNAMKIKQSALEKEEKSRREAAERLEAGRLETQRLETERLNLEKEEKFQRQEQEHTYREKETKRLEVEKFENQRLEIQRRGREIGTTFQRQERDRLEQEREIMIMRETKEREARERERQRLEGKRLAEEQQFEEERRFSQQRRDANNTAEIGIRKAGAFWASAASSVAQAASEKAEEIRKAEENMRIAFAAMAAQKGGTPVAVPSTLPPGIENAGPVVERIVPEDFRPQAVGVRPRPSIKGGLPSGPRGGALPPRRNPSVGQGVLNGPRLAEPPQLPPTREMFETPKRQNTLRPRPSIKGGLPSGPRGGGGSGGALPPRKTQSIDQSGMSRGGSRATGVRQV